MQELELLPCPFCGYNKCVESIVIGSIDGVNPSGCIVCPNCQIVVPKKIWNTRSIPEGYVKVEDIEWPEEMLPKDPFRIWYNQAIIDCKQSVEKARNG